MDSSPVRVLYHYTNLAALQAIRASGQLLPSLQRLRPRDVRYGQGQYLTDIVPGTVNTAQLSRLLVNHPYGASRFTHFLAIDVSGLTVRKGRDGVFVIPNDDILIVTGRIVRTGSNADDLPAS